jgi:hypothetical protein
MGPVEYNHLLGIFVGTFFSPFFWLLVLGVALWLVRRFFPKWEKTLFQKIPND